MLSPVFIDAYLTRIGYQGSREPTLATLQALHQAHLLAGPFENLSIHRGEPIVLEEAALFDKIVQHHRGGFCYELNGLFAELLQRLGFQVSLLSAGVTNGSGGFNPDYDHLTLLVCDLAGADWLADVGFGDSFRLPLCVEADSEQGGGDGKRYRLIQVEDVDYQKSSPAWILQQASDTQWLPQYRFTMQAHPLVDFTERCIYQQTSPESHFTQKRICSLATPQGRITLSDLTLITTLEGERKERVLSKQEYISVLNQDFGIVL